MLQLIRDYRVWCQGLVSAVLLLVNLTVFDVPVLAEPTPLTPAAVKYELERAKSPAEAGQQMQKMSRDYQQELKQSPTPIPNATKEATKKTKSFFDLFSKRVNETFNSKPSASH
ncbi:MAG: hypothetical protein NW220_18730 [Leptolyngbyaceae cyanobacterium bins.349]|nr:hypothetical protein [Leptolyngbyaceae cyanobacterium bins.349]